MIIPMLSYEDGVAAIEWLCRVFQFTEKTRWLDDTGRLSHGEIAMGESIYVIDPARCTECVGHHDEPQCVVVCPVECIDPDPAYPESHADLLSKMLRLQGS